MLDLTPAEKQKRTEKVYDLAAAYTDEDWGIVDGGHWDRLAAVAGEYARGENDWARTVALIEDTVKDVRAEAVTLREAAVPMHRHEDGTPLTQDECDAAGLDSRFL